MPNCKYSLIRYVADPLKNEPVNIGIILHAPDEQFLAFDWDLRRVATRITKSDKEALKHYESQLESVENQETDWNVARFEGFRVADTEFLEKISDQFGGKVIVAPPRGCVSPSADSAFEELFKRFVGTARTRAKRSTKRVLVHEVKQAFAERGVGEYVKSRPTIEGLHKAYTLPLGVSHSHKTFIEALNVPQAAEVSYRAMASIGRLWTDARQVASNRNATLCALIHYEGGIQIPEGERLLRDDGVLVVNRPAALLRHIEVERVREWRD